MSMHNKKTARLLQGVTLGLIIIATILFAGCENPVETVKIAQKSALCQSSTSFFVQNDIRGVDK